MCIQRQAGPFADGPEGLFPETVQFLHHVRGVRGRDQVGPVVAGLEEDLVGEGFDLRPDTLGGDMLRDRFLGGLFRRGQRGKTLCLKGIAAVAQVFPERGNVESGDFHDRSPPPSDPSSRKAASSGDSGQETARRFIRSRLEDVVLTTAKTFIGLVKI